MRRIRLVVAYDGTGYCGSQVQPNGVTVEEKLNEAVTKLTGTPAQVIFASRTDAGVHALGNVAVFDTEMRMAADKFTFALNQRLPEDIRIRRSDEVPEGWHPRKQNCTKTYEYRIYNHKIPNPLLRLYSQYCYYDLDLGKMREAARCLVGEHDFAAFCSAKSQADNTVRTIYGLTVEETPLGPAEGRLLTIRISGSGFLYNMVRIIAGTLLQIGAGVRPPENMLEILRSRDRQKAGPVAGASGLTLCSIAFEPALKPLLEAENEDWSWTLDQRDTETSGESRFTVRRCGARDYEALVTRILHAAHRNGAVTTLIRDLEAPSRLSAGQTYGFYTLEPADDASGSGYFLRARDRGARKSG